MPKISDGGTRFYYRSSGFIHRNPRSIFSVKRWDLLNFNCYHRCVVRFQIQVFTRGLQEYPLHSHGLIDPPKILADVVESTIGAIFIDSNSSIDTAWQVAKVLLEPIITPEMVQTNPVRKLNEICHKHNEICHSHPFNGEFEYHQI